MGSGSSEDPAVNMAGLPCTGITNSQANMSVEEAIQMPKMKDGYRKIWTFQMAQIYPISMNKWIHS